MSTTAFLGIESALVAALSTPTAVSSSIQTAEALPLAPQFADGIVVRVGSSDLEPAAVRGGTMRAITQVTIELRRLGPVGVSAVNALDVLFLAVNARITADPTLGGLVADCMLRSVQFDTVPAGEKPAHACTTQWEVLHDVYLTTLA